MLRRLWAHSDVPAMNAMSRRNCRVTVNEFNPHRCMQFVVNLTRFESMSATRISEITNGCWSPTHLLSRDLNMTRKPVVRSI